MKAVLRFFISMNTAFWAMGLVVALAFAGSLTLPAELAFFSGIDDVPLFSWLAGEGANLRNTWWIYGLVGALGLLVTSTVVCTADDLIAKGVKAQGLVRRLSPQVVHIGLCLVLLGYLLTSAYGTRDDMLLKRGQTEALSGSVVLSLEDILVQTGEGGYLTDWEASVKLIQRGKPGEAHSIRPARPAYGAGYGLYLKSVTKDAEGGGYMALIRVSHDPGVIWALVGGVLLVLGSAGLVLGREVR